MNLDTNTIIAIMSQVVSLAVGAWYMRGQFEKAKQETLDRAKTAALELFAKQQDLMVLSTKFDNMGETLNKIEGHLAHIAKGQKE